MPSFSNFLMNLNKLVLNPSVVHEVPLVVEQIVSRLCKSWLFKKVDNGVLDKNAMCEETLRELQ